MRILALLAGLSLFPLAVGLHGSVLSIIDISSMVIVVVGAALFTMGAHGGAGLMNALGAGLGNQPLTLKSCHEHRRVLESFRNALCASGAVGFLLGVVAILGNLEDPSALGPAVAVAMLTTLYALIIAELVIAPMSNALPSRVQGDVTPQDLDDDLLTKSRGVAVLFVVLISQASVTLGVVVAI